MNNKPVQINNSPVPPLYNKIQLIKSKLATKNHELCEIMSNFLNFNPYFRSTAYDCLKNCKVFDDVRNL